MRKWIFTVIVTSLLLFVMAGCEELPENKQTPTQKIGVSTSYPAGGQLPGPAAGYPASPSNPSDPYPAPGTSTIFQIVKADKSVFVMTKAAYDQLAQVKVSINNKDVSGARVKDVLKAAKITTFSKITITGSNGKVELSSGQVDDQLIMILSNGAMIQSPSLTSDKWIKDITMIKVD